MLYSFSLKPAGHRSLLTWGLACALLSSASGCSGCIRDPFSKSKTQPVAESTAEQKDEPPINLPSGEGASDPSQASGQEQGGEPSSGGETGGSETGGGSGGPNGSGGGDNPGGGSGGAGEASPVPDKVAAGQSGSPGSGESSNSESRPLTADDAHDKAAELKAAAQQAARMGNTQPALENALEGWQLVSRFPQDPACRALAAELEGLLRSYGEAMNGANNSTPSSKPIAIE